MGFGEKVFNKLSTGFHLAVGVPRFVAVDGVLVCLLPVAAAHLRAFEELRARGVSDFQQDAEQKSVGVAIDHFTFSFFHHKSNGLQNG